MDNEGDNQLNLLQLNFPSGYASVECTWQEVRERFSFFYGDWSDRDQGALMWRSVLFLITLDTTPFINEITNTAVYWFDSISDPLVHNKNEIDVESSFAIRVG